MKTYVSSIRKTDILSQNFNKIFDVIYPEVRTNKIESSYKDYIWKHLTGVYPRRNYGKRFYSLKVSQVLNKQGEINKSKSLLNQDLVLAYGLEEFVSQSKCVDYFFNNLLIEIPIEESNTSKKLIGLNEISSHYIRKPITDLNENEIIKLISIIDCHQHKVPNNQLNGRIKLLKNIFKYRTSKSNSH
ncbi:MAG: hypothetical protein GY827_01440 [Cytophagales bacterium]|nr:hypothetical protein [Cytophagales bacterium]